MLTASMFPITRARAGSPLLLLLLAACGSPKPAEAPVTKAPEVPAERPVAVAVDAPPDLTPAPAPTNMIVVGRIAKPSDIIGTVTDWASLPPFSSAELTEVLTGENTGPLIDLDKPVDGAVVSTGSGRHATPGWAVSAALVSFDEGKKSIGGRFKLAKAGNGVLRIEGLKGTEDDDGRQCVLAPAVGPTNGRLICGDKAGLEALVPWLSRTAPKAPSVGSDIHVELRTSAMKNEMKMVRALVEHEAGKVGRGGNAAAGNLAQALVADVGDLLGDVETLTLDGDMKPAGMTFRLTTSYQSQTSLIARIATASPEKAGPAPAAFWHLPGDTDMAVFGRGIDPKLTEHPRELLLAALQEELRDSPLPDAERKVLSDVIARSMTLVNAPTMYARGYDLAAVQKGLDGPKEDRKDAVMQAAIGWHLLETDESPQKVGGIVKDWVGFANRAEIQKLMSRTPEKAAKKPKVALVAAPKGAPKDTVHVEITVPRSDLDVTAPPTPPPPPPGARKGAPPVPPPPPPAKRTPRKPLVFHILSMPDQTRSIVGFGFDGELLSRKMIQSLSTSPDADTLKGREGLEALKNGKMNGAMFVTTRTIASTMAMDGKDPTRALGPAPWSPAVVMVSAIAPGTDARGGQSTITYTMQKPLFQQMMRMGKHR